MTLFVSQNESSDRLLANLDLERGHAQITCEWSIEYILKGMSGNPPEGQGAWWLLAAHKR